MKIHLSTISSLKNAAAKYLAENKIEFTLILTSLASLAAYLLTIWPPFGMLCIAAFLGLVLNDFINPKKQNKKRGLLREVVVPIAAALALWLLLTVALQTATPLNVVTSCSMVPVLERGDLIVVQGGNIKAPLIQVNESIDEIKAQINRSTCTAQKRSKTQISTKCTSSISIENFTVNTLRAEVQNSDVVVYEATPSQYGLIVHRALARIATGKEEFFLTKGDNNQVADQEAGISPVPKEKVQGKVIFRIPLIGYFKLFLYGQFSDPPGCDTLIK